MRRVSTILWSPVTCECRIAYGLWVDEEAPEQSTMRPERVANVCKQHTARYGPVHLASRLRSENTALNDARVQIQLCGAKAQRWAIVKPGQLVIEVSGASNSLREILARMDGIAVIYKD